MRTALSPSLPPPAPGRRLLPATQKIRTASPPEYPIHVVIAGAAGAVVGAVAAATAFWSYLHAGGPTGAGVAVIPGSLLIVAVPYVLLTRRHRRRASDWLGLGYTGAVVGVTGLLMMWEVLRNFYAALSFAAW